MDAEILGPARLAEQIHRWILTVGQLPRRVSCELDELGRLHLQWLSDLDAFKDSLRTQGAAPKVLECVNEAFGRLAERIKQLAG
jgi:hypothetical protein